MTVDSERFYLDDNTYGQNSPIGEIRFRKLFKAIRDIPGEALLDVGCGEGYIMDQIRSLRPELETVGIDISKAAIDKAKTSGFNVVLGDVAEALPFGNDRFDIIHAGEVIEHVLDTDFLVNEFSRVLKPNGVLLLSTPNLACWMNRCLLPFGFQPLFTEVGYIRNYGRRFSMLGSDSHPIGHLRVFTYSAAKEIINAHSFHVERAIGCAVVRHMFFKTLDRCLSVAPNLAPDVLFIAKNRKHSDVAAGTEE